MHSLVVYELSVGLAAAVSVCHVVDLCVFVCTGVCVFAHTFTSSTKYSGDGGGIIQSGEGSSSQSSHIDKEHWVIMQVCGRQEG